MQVAIQENYDLTGMNTFGVPARTSLYAEVRTEDELLQLHAVHKLNGEDVMVLGGGSNMLFTHDYKGLVVKPAMTGIRDEVLGDEVRVYADAGVVWQQLVSYCVQRGYAGMENLSLIPGTVGASPVQNIGAYGVELQDVFLSCRALDTTTGSMVTLDRDECLFRYRNSIFKTEEKGRYIITRVTYKLSKTARLKLGYGAIQQELEARNIVEPTIQNVADVVSTIRTVKLPDPSTIGNAGSFFKNPVISAGDFKLLQEKFPTIVNYVTGDGVKLAAGWLIEQCGFKGVKYGHTGTWKHQALVIVNYGGATGREVYDFSEMVINTVYRKFSILLEREVNII